MKRIWCRGGFLFAGTVLVFLIANVWYFQSRSAFTPDFVDTYGFRVVTETTENGVSIRKFNAEASFEQIRMTAINEFTDRGYKLSERNSEPVFYRGSKAKAALYRGMCYDSSGTLRRRQGSVALWISEESSIWKRFYDELWGER